MGARAAIMFGLLRKQSILMIAESPFASSPSRTCRCGLGTAPSVPRPEHAIGLDAPCKAGVLLMQRGITMDFRWLGVLVLCLGMPSAGFAGEHSGVLAPNFMSGRALLCGKIQRARRRAVGPQQGRQRSRDRSSPALPEARRDANRESAALAAARARQL